ncbi:MAG: 2-amino-4-hydroxy-6-hydroxymethyldihydropteridine diphosphokinase [Actinomycetota bacterium]|nr:2-amino-4-hydroxy-6-hydroxymethyldihydropteridine diphosphokinase [Acidimicrobiaceae bacterium]MED5552368.1 2-amino-4-hydroxy-6-hydroxymethyldihydropteridine diphosphokinase [Actinomycetota bacterium]|tara:strand:+ start:1633 stop:2103 length:471 start_codon:yes stop_codon:yes gene_type:complete
MSQTVRAFVGLGSNLGDRRAFLSAAVRDLPNKVAVSGVYKTAPIGGPAQGPFLNLVVEMRTSVGPYDLLAICQQLEASAGRARTERWGPRTLDVDVLLYGEFELDDTELTIPHPRMNERAFVLYPLAELAPELLPSRWRETVSDQEIVRVDDLLCC